MLLISLLMWIQKKTRFFTSTHSSLCFFFLMFAHLLSLLFIRKNRSGRWCYSLVCNSFLACDYYFFFFPLVLLQTVWMLCIHNNLWQYLACPWCLSRCLCVYLKSRTFYLLFLRSDCWLFSRKIACWLLQASLLDPKFSLLSLCLTMKCQVCYCILS